MILWLWVNTFILFGQRLHFIFVVSIIFVVYLELFVLLRFYFQMILKFLFKMFVFKFPFFYFSIRNRLSLVWFWIFKRFFVFSSQDPWLILKIYKMDFFLVSLFSCLKHLNVFLLDALSIHLLLSDKILKLLYNLAWVWELTTW